MPLRSTILALLTLPASLTVACGGDDTTDSAVDSVAETDPCGATSLDWGQGGGDMLPGTDCLECHVAGGDAPHLPLTVGGTAFTGPDCPEGIADATVTLVDADGTTVELTSSELGNFWTSEELVFPLEASIDVGGVVTVMETPVTSGACALCHAEGSDLGFVWAER